MGQRTRRPAAKKASQLASEQLQSSPIRSEDEYGAPTFGEPSRPKVQVKVTYAGKKSKSQSPSKSGPSRIPEAKNTTRRPSASTSLSAPRSRVGMASVRGRKSTKQPVGTPSSVTGRQSRLNVRTPSPLPPKVSKASSKAAHTVSMKNGKKRRHSSPSHDEIQDDGDDSDLTPLSSDAEDMDDSVRAKRRASSHSAVTPQHYVPSVRSTALDEDEESTGWAKGDYVWVHVDAAGAVSESKESMWWPAQVRINTHQ